MNDKLTGKRYDKLYVVGFLFIDKRVAKYLCSCYCGNFVIKGRDYLSRKFFKSCGCVNSKGLYLRKQYKSYTSWQSMIQRCTTKDVSQKSYKNYVLRGITFPERWKEFYNFLEDMGERPYGHTLDRINNNENYGKDNCRWVLKDVQEFNKRKLKNCTSNYKGVSFNKKEGKYRAYVKFDGIQKHIGYFSDEKDAARARDIFIIKLKWMEVSLGASFKDYLNFPEEYYVSI